MIFFDLKIVSYICETTSKIVTYIFEVCGCVALTLMPNNSQPIASLIQHTHKKIYNPPNLQYIYWVVTYFCRKIRKSWWNLMMCHLAFFLIKSLGRSPTVTKDSETLGFSHLGAPTYNSYGSCAPLFAHFKHWVHLMGLNVPAGSPNIAARSQSPTGKTPQQSQITFCGCMLGTVLMMESYGTLWCVIWHFFSSKVWVGGPTVTKDSETLGFSHLGAPTYN